MAKSLCSVFLALILISIFAATNAHAAVIPTTCTIDEVFTACTGSAALCSTYLASGTCNAASGCGWTASSSDSTPWSEGFSSSGDWQPSGSGLAATHHDSGDCIDDANDKCIMASGGADSSTLSKKSNEDLSSCDSATFNIAKVDESGTLESDDCTYVKFSSNGGSTWSSAYTIFCDDNPSSTFQQSIPSQYLTSQFRTQFSKHGFTSNGEEAYLDGLSVTCTQDTSSCTGSPAACDTYVTDSACTAANGCTSNCRDLTFCGDGITQNPNDDQVAEACDDGNAVNTDACMNDCTLPVCGDQILSTGEACDDGNIASGDGCTSACVIEYCGDGIDNNGVNEACDDGNQVNDDACSNTCVANVCGDGAVNNGEACDDGASNGIACEPGYNDVCDYCTLQCTPARATGPYCGDNVVNGPETCETGDQIADPAHYTCNGQTCTLDYVPYCGDGNVDQGEQCDAGDQTGNYCTPAYGSSCTFCGINCINETMTGDYCGDGQLNGDEQCDDHNNVDNDGCSATCTLEQLQSCEEQGGIQTCIGESNACDSYVDSQSCTFAGCDWSASQGQNDVTQWSESFASPASDWATYASSGNGISLNINDNSNCINDANDDCLKFDGDGSPTTSTLTKQTNVDLSACESGSAVFSIAKVKESGTLDNTDCAKVWFSNDGGSTWGGETTIFCDDNPAATFSTAISDAYLTSQMRVRIERENFGAEGERAYLDGFSITCDIAGESVCQGSPDACGTYNDNEQACLTAGCDTTCEIPETYCGDNVVNGDETCEANDDVLEPKHYTCEQCQLVLQPYCGDGNVTGEEACDDGNTENNDGCSGICEVEEFICDPQQQLVANGGFETPIVTDGSGWDIYPDGTSGLEWSVEWASAYDGAPEVANAELHRGVNGWLPSEGQQYTELDSDWNGHNEGPNGEQSSVRMYQDIATVPGETYHIRFQFSPRPSTDNTQNVLEFYWDGVLQDTILANGGGNTAWTTHEYDLVATGTTTRIAFEDAGTPNSEGTFLDDVSVLCTPREEEYCPYEVVSDTHTGLQAGGNAQLVAQPYHPAWTASVPGALWVWDGSGVNAVNFTDSVVIAGPVSDALLRVASDNSYRIWINGVLIGSDAEEFNYASGHEEEYDVSSYLNAGANAFVFEVDNWHGPGGLLYKLTYTDVCEQPDEYCGDGIVNQESEQCDTTAPEGYECFQDCTLHMTCEEAIAQHLLTGEIVGGTATVQNDAEDDFVVSLASYEMYAPLIEDQVLFDHDTQLVEGGSSAEFGVELPLCAYQIDLVCGEPKETNPDYTEEQKLDFAFGNQEAGFCTPDDQGDASLIVAEGFPQCNNFVFECNVEGFEPTAYYWYFGDGEILPNTTQQNVYHTFTPGEDFTVTCTASDGEHFAADSVDVHAGTCCGDGVVQELDDEQIAEQCDGSAPEQYTCDDSCQLHLTCEGAIQQGLLTGEIVDGTATVQNDADEDYLVSLASYEMYALLIEDQVLFDSDSTTVGAGEGAELSVELPACTYQIDLVCGEPLPFVPLYGDRVIDFHFGNQEADFCTPTQRESDATVTVSVQDGFPQSEEGAAHYVFTCDVDGFVPTGYYWYFGDGELLPNVVNDNVWHTYTENGDYTVACTATNGSEWQTGTLGISVEGIEPPVEPSVSVSVDPYYPQGNAFVFICDTEGFTPTSYDWDFGDGEILYDLLTDDVYHTFDHNGDYTVTCTASDGETSASGSIGVSASACVAYDVAITNVEPNPAAPESTVTVSGTVTESANPSADLSGHTLDVNGESVGILLNAWSTTVDVGTEDVPVTATIWNACEDGYSDSTTVTVEQGEQGGDEPFIELQAGGEEPTLFSSGGGKGDCAPGYHREGDSCVKNLAATIAGGSESTGVEGADGTTTDEGAAAAQDGVTGDGDLLTGAVTGGGFGSWTWLLALLALIAALLGYAYYKYE